MDYLLHILILCGIYIIFTESLNLMVGYTGIISMGHAAFFGVGAYTSALLSLKLGCSVLLAMFLGACGAGVCGILIGLPTLKLKGEYLVLVTLGFGEVVHSIFKNWIGLTRGPMGLPGIPKPSIFGFQFETLLVYLMFVAVIVFITTLVMIRIVDSPFGRVLRAIRDDEIGALFLGKDVKRYKTYVFIIAAFFAGLAGSLYAHYITFIDPSSFTIMESVMVLLMVIFGGMASIKGSFFGAIVLVILPEILRFVGLPSSIAAATRQMIYAFLLVVIVLRRPQGLFGKYEFEE